MEILQDVELPGWKNDFLLGIPNIYVFIHAKRHCVGTFWVENMEEYLQKKKDPSPSIGKNPMILSKQGLSWSSE